MTKQIFIRQIWDCLCGMEYDYLMSLRYPVLYTWNAHVGHALSIEKCLQCAKISRSGLIVIQPINCLLFRSRRRKQTGSRATSVLRKLCAACGNIHLLEVQSFELSGTLTFRALQQQRFRSGNGAHVQQSNVESKFAQTPTELSTDPSCLIYSLFQLSYLPDNSKILFK